MNREIKSSLTAFLISWSLAACTTIPSDDVSLFERSPLQSISSDFETEFEKPEFLPSASFLPVEMFKSPNYGVDQRTFNDGFSNTYKLNTSDHVYVMQGTSQTVNLGHEIEVTHKLRQQSSIETAQEAVTQRMINLGKTPLRAVKGLTTEARKVENTQDAILFIPSKTADILTNLTNGLKEMGVTGLRLANNAAQSQCRVIECIAKAGEDVWYAANSLIGKHTDAKNLHLVHGTSPETQNKVLKREINRLAYSESYVGTASKFALGAANIPVLAIATQGIGFYNNAEYLAKYKDPYRQELNDKAALSELGVSDDVINLFYQNKSYTRPLRASIAATLIRLDIASIREPLLKHAGEANTRYSANASAQIYVYLARLADDQSLNQIWFEAPPLLATLNDGTLIMPISVDYITWTKKSSKLINALTRLNRSTLKAKAVEIHIIGKASLTFKKKCNQLGLKIVELNL